MIIVVNELLYEQGVDFDSRMIFQDGDILLTGYEDNLAQAVVNRLNTQLNELDWFYEDYGSVLTGFFGWKANTNTLQYIKTEINTVLKQEPRLSRWDCNVGYDGEGKIRIELTLYPDANLGINVNLVLTPTGVVDFEIPAEDLITVEE